jgi:hypothetical protein
MTNTPIQQATPVPSVAKPVEAGEAGAMASPAHKRKPKPVYTPEQLLGAG